MATDASRLLEYVADRKPQMTAYLKELVLAESPSLSPDAQDQVLALLEKPLRKIGFETRRISGRHSGGQLCARREGSGSDRLKQLLVGHCDTVWPEGTLEEMPVAIDGNVMKGPGVYDMKVGLAQIVFALKALHDLGIEPELDPIVLITSDEELGSQDSRAEIESLARVSERVFIPEPSTGPDGKIKTARKGVGVFTIIVEGKSAHAGVEPEKGVSAVLELPAIIESLQSLNDPQSGVTLNIGVIEAGTRTNIVPDRCEIGVDVRLPSAADASRIKKAVRALRASQPGAHIKICGGIERPPMEKTPRNRALWKAAQKIGREIGLDLEESYTGGGSDGNFTSSYAATLDGLGGVGGGAHAKTEFILLDKMVERTALLALLLTLPPITVE
jgi:glutamate carboxypeptidase